MVSKIAEHALSWIPEDDIEPAALQQIRNLAEMPFIFKHVAVMPDCHLGAGTTVGTCIPTYRAVIPAAVGIDVGYGMIAARTPFHREQMPAGLAAVREEIEANIPLSAGKYNSELTPTATKRADHLSKLADASGRAKFYEQGTQLAPPTRFPRQWHPYNPATGKGKKPAEAPDVPHHRGRQLGRRT